VNRRNAERGGRRAEAIAALRLQLKGWAIMARRARTPVGEVDLIARRGRTLAFVEVKARASQIEAERALDDWRLRRVAAAAQALAPRYEREGDTLRIDAIFIVPRRWPRHMKDIWRG
jgi:putative endonuclease